MKEFEKMLTEAFEFPFHKEQKQALESILEGRDVLGP